MSALPETSPTEEPVESNGSSGGKLSPTTVGIISILSVVGMISIALLLFGDFEGKISRVVSTLVLFGLFTFCSSYHLGNRKSNYQLPMLAQAGNIYMLLLSLTLIWGTLAVDNYGNDITLLPLTLLIVGLVQLGIFIAQWVGIYINAEESQLSVSALLTTLGMIAATVLFTVPIALNDMQHFGEGYWKFAIAVILFTGLMLSITRFIIWAFTSRQPTSVEEGNFHVVKEASHAVPEFSPKPENIQKVRDTPSHRAAQQGFPEFSPPTVTAMPWPVFPNGQPLPAKSNGRPDFIALEAFAKHCAESERQFFG